MFSLFTAASSLLQMSSQPIRGGVNALSLGGKDVIAARAQDVAGSSILPLEVLIVLIGALLVSGFLLLLRESRIERNAARNKHH